MTATLDDNKLKALMKEAIIELLQEQHEAIYAMLMEIIEELALVRAIKEGETSKPVSRKEILDILEK